MLGLAIALIVVGVLVLFIIPFVGIPVGIVGLLLLVAYLVGFGRRGRPSTGP